MARLHAQRLLNMEQLALLISNICENRQKAKQTPGHWCAYWLAS
jgi:hypothetical protein